jgi:pyruvate/2-oxoglutarate dehydrogenase complex dihydrolipoamide dehydrogenase (E3) component
MATTEPNQGATGTADPTPPPAPPRESPLSVDSQSDVLDERPELLVAGAFVGGLVLAQVLRKLGPS